MDWKCYKAYIYITKTTHRKKKITIIRKISSKLGNSWYNAIERDRHQKGVHQNMNTVFDVANWFLNKEPMTHKKLQKLCYYAQAWYLALKNEPLINSNFEAWVHGPVSRNLYKYYQGSGLNDLRADKPAKKFKVSEEEILESVWETYGEYTGNALEVLTHSEPPWKNARGDCGTNARCTNKIKHEDMKNYYRSIYIGQEDAEA